MKKIIFNIAILLMVKVALAQDTIKPPTSANADNIFNDITETQTSGTVKKITKIVGGLKNEDNVLPRWTIDASYKVGKVTSSLTHQDINRLYNTTENTTMSPLEYSNGKSNGVNFQIAYFLGKSRRLGIGTGLNWNQFNGDVKLNSFLVQYKGTNKNDLSSAAPAEYRQIITLNGALVENTKMTSYSIPITLKFKHQFKNMKLGFTADASLLVGISAKNKSSITNTAKFDYEAWEHNDVFGNSTYDSGDLDIGTLQITRAYWSKNQTSEESVNDYFNRKKLEGFNVGLDQEINKKDLSSEYKGSPFWGFSINPAITYQLGYNTTFMLGAFYSYQVFNNKGNVKKLTDNIGEYNSINYLVSKNVVTNYGMNIGFRFFFGEKKDLDGDGIYDKGLDRDKCPEIPGVRNLAGCPDSDGDGVKDDDDKCANEYGSKDCDGCPDDDDDHIANAEDACPNEFGIFNGNPKYNGCPESTAAEGYYRDKGLAIPTAPAAVEKPRQIEDYFVVLQKDFINFSYGNSVVLPSNFEVLDNTIKVLNENPKFIILVSGHTDNIGSYETNMKLSMSRANAVMSYLVNHGINADRIITKGYAYEKPKDDNSSELGRANNRRTEMRLLAPITTK